MHLVTFGQRDLRGSLDMHGLHDLLQIRIATEPLDFRPDLCFEIVHDIERVVEGLRAVAEVGHDMRLQRRRCGSLLENVYKRGLG